MKRKPIVIQLFSLLILLYVGFACQPKQKNNEEPVIAKETYVYAIKEGDTLRLDRYYAPQTKECSPCVVYMFGGGFYTGARDDDKNVAYMHQLAKKGLNAIAIDYRLGLKDFAPGQTEGESEEQSEAIYLFGQVLLNAVNMAVDDLFDATHFVVDNALAWGIDPEQIIANGSSAGAVSVLQGEYYISNGHPEYIHKLPEDFNYAGVISFAGAILAENKLNWSNQPAPLLLFHGNMDSNVPYDKILFEDEGLFGSKSIAASLDSLQSPYYFCAFNNRAHEIASTPATDNLDEIESFINRFVIDRQEDIVVQKIRKANEKETNPQFEITDYIKSNF